MCSVQSRSRSQVLVAADSPSRELNHSHKPVQGHEPVQPVPKTTCRPHSRPQRGSASATAWLRLRIDYSAAVAASSSSEGAYFGVRRANVWVWVSGGDKRAGDAVGGRTIPANGTFDILFDGKTSPGDSGFFRFPIPALLHRIPYPLLPP